MVTTIDSRRLTERHWKAVKTFGTIRLQPDEFQNKWGVSRPDLAELCDCSLSTVNHWFSRSGKIDEKYTRRLAEVDYIWECIDSCPDHLMDVYKRRKQR